MRRSRHADFSGRAECRTPVRRRFDGRGFTLVELICVLVLLAIVATFVATSLGGFFRARALNAEARRMLSLTHYGQSRAVSEGAPVVLWVNTQNSTYGLNLLSSFSATDGDPHAIAYTTDATLTLETPTANPLDVSEQSDEKLGLPDNLVAIRFNADGFIDPSSVHKITIRQGQEAALELVPTANGLGYEIRTASIAN